MLCPVNFTELIVHALDTGDIRINRNIIHIYAKYRSYYDYFISAFSRGLRWNRKERYDETGNY